MSELYPVFEIPTLQAADSAQEESFLPSPLFDFDTGDFVRDGANRIVMVNGRDAFILWTLKMLKTQLGACASYIESGIDLDACLQQPTREAVQSALERTITEALLSNRQVARVYNFDFSWQASELYLSFIVEPKAWDAFDVGMKIAT